MSKNIVIQEGGTGKQFTAAKLKTATVGGGSCLWVPEDETSLGTKHITKDGTYTAASEGIYGYSEVTVSGIGKVVGVDPVTGEEKEVGTQPDPETGEPTIVEKVIPTSIDITTDPTREEYNDGDLIDFSGMVVKAKTKTGAVFTDETYPDGIIPQSEWITPVKVTHYDQAGPHGFIARSDSLVYEAGLLYTNNGNRSPVYKANDGWCACILNTDAEIDTSPWISITLIGLNYGDVTVTGDNVPSLRGMFTIDGQNVYYLTTGTNHAFGGGTQITSNPHGLPVISEQLQSVNQGYTTEQFNRYLQILGFQITGEGDKTIQKVPVQWLCPYGKMDTYEDEFAILVNPPVNSNEGESS